MVVDDQHIVREGLMSLLDLMDDIEVVGGAADGAEAVRLASETSPRVVLMDLRMPGMGGAEATRRILSEHPDVAVLVLSTFADDESLVDALNAGACGYLTKDANQEQIAVAIRSSAQGQSTFDPAVTRRLAAALSVPAAPAVTPSQSPQPPSAPAPARRRVNPDGLTGREVDVLKLIAQGLSNGEIASTLFIEETTVKTHINNAFAKINARNRADAVRYAYQRGLAHPSDRTSRDGPNPYR